MAASAAVVLMLLALGGWAWWRATTGPVDPAVIGGCPTARMGQFELVWASEHAATATLISADGTAEPVPLSGAERRCAPDGTVFTLEVTGPGGTVTRTVEATVQGAPGGLDDSGGPDEPEETKEPVAPDPAFVAP